jgi:hypothetical protein
MSPVSASPVLKTKITFTLDNDFTYELDKADLSCNATNITNPSYVRYLNIISVDNSASPKTFVAMFGGAWSGQYEIHLSHKLMGVMDTRGMVLDVNTNITSFSPMFGSIYGGTLLTIQGTNFGKEIQDNPVQISRNGGLGSIDCYLESIKETEIKCRIDSSITPKKDGDAHHMVVFLKVSEEANCDFDTTCRYTWTTTIPQIDSVEVEFDTTTYTWQYKTVGVSMTGDTTTTELLIGGTKQETVSVSETEAVFTISNVTDYTFGADSLLYFDVGLPENFDLAQQNFEISPKLVSISPTSGSA